MPTLNCGRCGSTAIGEHGSWRAGDMYPDVYEADYQCRDCGTMLYTYERHTPTGIDYLLIDNGHAITDADAS